ncbi:MAG: glycoside hydrolase family 130 protein [Planctomycetota bacterium]
MKADQVLKRYSENPILVPSNMPFPCSAVFNAGAVRFGNEYLLLLRVEDYTRRTDFYVATSRDGYNFEVRPEPVNYPLRKIEKEYTSDRFDMRITPLDGVYYVCHALWLKELGCVIAMAKTDDFVNFEPLAVSVPSNRNAVLFPEKIGSRYVRLERPQDIDGKGQMWISYSEDLKYWGDSAPVRTPATNWSLRKCGAGIVPIKTAHGWLEIYHATAYTASTLNYFLGAMLMDLQQPEKLIAAPKEFLLAAQEDYERVGQTPNVVFTCGAIETDDGKLLVYYGGADTCVCVAETTVEELVNFCLKSAN